MNNDYHGWMVLILAYIIVCIVLDFGFENFLFHSFTMEIGRKAPYLNISLVMCIWRLEVESVGKRVRCMPGTLNIE